MAKIKDPTDYDKAKLKPDNQQPRKRVSKSQLKRLKTQGADLKGVKSND